MSVPADGLSDLLEKVRSGGGPVLPPVRRRKRIRLKARLTQEDVAKALGVKRETVARWELGTRTPVGENAARYGELLDRIDAAAREAKEVRP